MQRTRIVLAGLSGMLHDIVTEAVMGQPDMLIVADHERPPSPLHALGGDDAQTDVLVLGREPTGTELVDLYGCSQITVLALSEDGRNGYRYQLRPERVQLGEEMAGISTESLINAIRAASKQHGPD